jgi:hypothetical protein
MGRVLTMKAARDDPNLNGKRHFSCMCGSEMTEAAHAVLECALPFGIHRVSSILPFVKQARRGSPGVPICINGLWEPRMKASASDGPS